MQQCTFAQVLTLSFVCDRAATPGGTLSPLANHYFYVTWVSNRLARIFLTASPTVDFNT